MGRLGRIGTGHILSAKVSKEVDLVPKNFTRFQIELFHLRNVIIYKRQLVPLLARLEMVVFLIADAHKLAVGVVHLGLLQEVQR